MAPRIVLAAVLCALALPASGRAQQPTSLPQRPSPRGFRREIPGFDFRRDGVWRRDARAVRALRRRLLSRRSFGALNAPMATGGGAALAGGVPLRSNVAVSGVLKVPAIIFKFKDTQASQLRNSTQYDQVLFAAAPTGASAGRPYTYRSFYEQMSNGLLSVQGQTYGYAALDSNEVTYTGTAGTCIRTATAIATGCSATPRFSGCKPGCARRCANSTIRSTGRSTTSTETATWISWPSSSRPWTGRAAARRTIISGRIASPSPGHPTRRTR